MAKSQEIIIIDLKELLKQQINEAFKKGAKEIKIVINNSELDSDVIDVEKELKRRRNSMGYFSINPENSNSG
ncbi:MAG: hypothetical protein ACFFD5_02325 [Candidatus Thorarchaeota archaeon]